MEQNKEYIDAYDKTFGPEYDYMSRPSEYHRMTADNQQHSAVFNFFKASFRNIGGWECGGTNWFVNGNDNNIYPQNAGFHGFFSKVFSKNDNIAEETKNMSKENFNLYMKKAFKEHKAIGFSVYGFANPNSGVHAMTIWGAEFDANGDVAYIYFCDNNSSEGEPNHASIRRFKVVYDNSTIPELSGKYAFLMTLPDNGNTTTYKASFTSLTVVDLRRDIWQKYFPDIK